MQPLIAGPVACVIAYLLYLSLDSGRAGEPTPRLVSLPLGALAAIFAARAWTLSIGQEARWASVFGGLALGVGGYAIVRLFIV